MQVPRETVASLPSAGKFPTLHYCSSQCTIARLPKEAVMEATQDTQRRTGNGRARPAGFPSVIFIRLLVSLVFMSEGIQTFLFPLELCVGRFLKFVSSEAFFSQRFFLCVGAVLFSFISSNLPGLCILSSACFHLRFFERRPLRDRLFQGLNQAACFGKPAYASADRE